MTKYIYEVFDYWTCRRFRFYYKSDAKEWIANAIRHEIKMGKDEKELKSRFEINRLSVRLTGQIAHDKASL